MNIRRTFPALLAIAALAAVAASRQTARADGDEVERGRYLVRQVSLCNDCHGAALTGGHVGHNPAAPYAPAIAGLPGLDVEAVALFLETGNLNGATVPPPMPRYRMHPDDAHAVAVFLRSLPASPSPLPAATAAP
jgi:mono/diheme cytochrome c family protein